MARELLTACVHGEYELMARFVDSHLKDDDRLVVFGDSIDGPDSKRLIQLLVDLGGQAVSTLGNHEWVLRNALADDESEERSHWQEVWGARQYGYRILESYGVSGKRDSATADELRSAMDEVGHLTWLRYLPAYYETDTHIAVHAGPNLSDPWEDQRAKLETASAAEAALTEEPDQIFSHKLATLTDTPEVVSTKRFVTAHTHFWTDAARIAFNRVAVGARLSAAEPLIVWDSEAEEIIEFNQSA